MSSKIENVTLPYELLELIEEELPFSDIRHKVTEILAAHVVERQPVAWIELDNDAPTGKTIDWYHEDLRELPLHAKLYTAPPELAELQADMAQKVILAVRDACELEPADADDPETVCIKASDLGLILSRHFEGIE